MLFFDVGIDFQDHLFGISEYLRDLLRRYSRYLIAELRAEVVAEDMCCEPLDRFLSFILFGVRIIP